MRQSKCTVSPRLTRGIHTAFSLSHGSIWEKTFLYNAEHAPLQCGMRTVTTVSKRSTMNYFLDLRG